MRYLNKALELAKRSTERHRHGAVLVKNGNVLSWGYNKMKSHPLVFGDNAEDLIKNHSGVHAEVDAIRKVANPENAVLYVARLRRTGEPGLSKPCDRCEKAIADAGIKKVIFTIDED